MELRRAHLLPAGREVVGQPERPLDNFVLAGDDRPQLLLPAGVLEDVQDPVTGPIPRQPEALRRDIMTSDVDP